MQPEVAALSGEQLACPVEPSSSAFRPCVVLAPSGTARLTQRSPGAYYSGLGKRHRTE